MEQVSEDGEPVTELLVEGQTMELPDGPGRSGTTGTRAG